MIRNIHVDEKGVPSAVEPPQDLAAAFAQCVIHDATSVAVYGDAEKSWGGKGCTCCALVWLRHRGPIRLVVQRC